jgi:hypothetical protein
MTVKELKDILDACNDTAEVIVHTSTGLQILKDEQVYQLFDLSDNGTVIFSVRDVEANNG